MAVLDFLDRNPGCSAAAVAAHIEASDAWARRVMRTLGCTCGSTNRVSRWYPPLRGDPPADASPLADSEPPIAVPCSDGAPSQSEQPRPGAGERAGGEESSRPAAALTVHSPPPPEVDVDPPSLAPPEADGSGVELPVLLEALRLALGLDDQRWTAGELVAEVHQLREDHRKLSTLIHGCRRVLARGRSLETPEGGDLVDQLQGAAGA